MTGSHEVRGSIPLISTKTGLRVGVRARGEPVFLKTHSHSHAVDFYVSLTYLLMFDFQKLEVYSLAKLICKSFKDLIKVSHFDRVTSDQLRRASFSIMLNIAEGSSRFTNKDRKHFLVMARGSVFECAAIIEYLMETGEIAESTFKEYFARLEEISKMLFALIRNLNK